MEYALFIGKLSVDLWHDNVWHEMLYAAIFGGHGELLKL